MFFIFYWDRVAQSFSVLAIIVCLFVPFILNNYYERTIFQTLVTSIIGQTDNRMMKRVNTEGKNNYNQYTNKI